MQKIPIVVSQEPHQQYERQKDITPEDESQGGKIIGEERKAITNSSRKNEKARSKQKQCSVMNVSSDESKDQHYKKQYCIGTWNVRSMNQGKFEVVKQEMARMNTDILGISELK